MIEKKKNLIFRNSTFQSLCSENKNSNARSALFKMDDLTYIGDGLVPWIGGVCRVCELWVHHGGYNWGVDSGDGWGVDSGDGWSMVSGHCWGHDGGCVDCGHCRGHDGGCVVDGSDSRGGTDSGDCRSVDCGQDRGTVSGGCDGWCVVDRWGGTESRVAQRGGIGSVSTVEDVGVVHAAGETVGSQNVVSLAVQTEWPWGEESGGERESCGVQGSEGS